MTPVPLYWGRIHLFAYPKPLINPGRYRIRYNFLTSLISRTSHPLCAFALNLSRKLQALPMTLQSSQTNWEQKTLHPTLSRFPERKPDFQTSSGISVPRLLTPSRRGQLHRKIRFPRRIPLHARCPADHVPRPFLDDAAVRRIRHRRGLERSATATCFRAGPDRPLRRLRPPDADRLRLPTTRWPRRRGRQGRRRDRSSIEDMLTFFRDIPLDKVSRPAMTINATAGVHPARSMYIAVGKRQGVEPTNKLARHDPERHPQGVHRPRHLHLSPPPPRCG
jgi:hypothetical protein